MVWDAARDRRHTPTSTSRLVLWVRVPHGLAGDARRTRRICTRMQLQTAAALRGAHGAGRQVDQAHGRLLCPFKSDPCGGLARPVRRAHTAAAVATVLPLNPSMRRPARCSANICCCSTA